MNRFVFLIIAAPLVLTGGLVNLIFAPPARLATGSATGYTPAILSLIGACPDAVARLGGELEFSLYRGGFGGNYKSGEEAGEGFAYGTLVVLGTSGTASVEYQMSKDAGLWSPSLLVLTFDDGKRLDVEACTRAVVTARQSEAGLKLFAEQCEQGRAAMCITLSLLAQAGGDAAAEASWAKKACDLGAKEACR
jgi:hypothetical protein